MVAEHELRTAILDELPDDPDDARTVRSAVAKIADENKPTPINVIATVIIAQELKQGAECLDFAVDVTDDVDWTGEQLPDEPVALRSGHRRVIS
jgi:hypothetical protein